MEAKNKGHSLVRTASTRTRNHTACISIQCKSPRAPNIPEESSIGNCRLRADPGRDTAALLTGLEGPPSGKGDKEEGMEETHCGVGR
jgi:hypothetical protein